MNWASLALSIITWALDLFVKDANRKKKMVEFIESRIGTTADTVRLREDYERQIKEFEEKTKDVDSPLH